jgi:chromosome segregation ATPase
VRLAELENEVNRLTADLTTARTELKQEQENRLRYQSDLSSLKSALSQLQPITRTIYALRAQLNGPKSELPVDQVGWDVDLEDSDISTTHIPALQMEITRLTADCTQLQSTANQKAGDCMKLESELSALRAHLSEFERSRIETSKLMEEISALRAQVDESKAANDWELGAVDSSDTAELRQKVADLTAQLRDLKSEHEAELRIQAKKSKQTMAAIEKQVQSQKKIIEEFSRERADQTTADSFRRAELEIERLQIAASAFDADRSSYLDTIADLRLEAQHQSRSIDELQAKVNQLEAAAALARIQDRILAVRRISEIIKQLKLEHRDVRNACDAAFRNLLESIRHGKQQAGQRTDSRGQQTEMVETTYLRRTIVRFFSADRSEQDQIVPVILKLVGCDRALVDACVAQWKEGHRILPFSFF